MHEFMHITNKNGNPRNLFCGYIVMSAKNTGTLMNSRDVSNIPLG